MSQFTRRQFAAGMMLGVAAPAVLRSAHAQGATLKIGQVVPITGPAAEAGKYAMAGAKIALETINKNGGVLGKQVEIITEDDQTTNPGAVLAFSKLATNPEIVGFIASIRSTQMHAMAPDILKTAKPTMFGGTDPTLTKLGNPWLFRCRPNDTYSGKVIAEFGVKELGLKKWGIVHSTDAFGTNGMKALEESLKALGVTPVVIQGYANQSQDFTPVVLALKQAGIDILSSYFTFEGDLGIFARQLRQLGVNAPWVGSPSIVNTSAIKLAGPALNDTYGVADYAEDSSPEAKAFATSYRAVMKVAPDNQSSWTFDAMNLLAAAINKAGKTDPAAVRDAMLSIKGYKGAEGEYNFDKNGDGLHGYNVVKNVKGNIEFAKHIEFPA
jgi:branched-chain amino acid transport system substrate-binding protein